MLPLAVVRKSMLLLCKSDTRYWQLTGDAHTQLEYDTGDYLNSPVHSAVVLPVVSPAYSWVRGPLFLYTLDTRISLASNERIHPV